MNPNMFPDDENDLLDGNGLTPDQEREMYEGEMALADSQPIHGDEDEDEDGDDYHSEGVNFEPFKARNDRYEERDTPFGEALDSGCDDT